MPQPLRFAYTPDPDDAFHYCALQSGQLPWPSGGTPEFVHGHIKDLNESCLVERYDVCAISSVFYPAIADRYVILASGASVGRDYGPVLGGRPGLEGDSLAGRKVAVPGTSTTGNFLLQYFYEGYRAIPMAFDAVAEAIAAGEVDAGVLIHEELLNFDERPIRKICCLGHRWYEHARLPLPVGLVVARRALGMARLLEIESLLHDSMRWALDHRDEAMRFASQFGRGPLSRVREDFVARFANEDTLCMPADVRLGLSTLYTKAMRRGFIDRMPSLDIIDPPEDGPRGGRVAA